MRFLDKLNENQKASIILESVIRLAKWMKLSVVSEGVETQKEWEYLRSVECDAVQGYYFYRPMPQEDYIALLDKIAANSTNLLFHSSEEADDSILDVFNQTNTMESVLFYSMLGGMGLLEVCNGEVELIRVNNGYYETVYNKLPRERNILNQQFREPERSFLLEQCRIAKEEAKIQQFQLHHRREDDSYVWLSVKLRHLGGSSLRSLFLFAADNIEDLKKAEHERYVTNYSTVFLKLFDRVYHLDYFADTIELLHTSGEDFIEPKVQYSSADFFKHLAEVTSPQDLAKLKIVKDKALLDEALAQEHTNCLPIHYEFCSANAVTDTTAYFFKAELPDGGERYLCCVKKNS